MNVVNDYKKFLNEIITVNHVIISPEFQHPVEYIQGKLLEVNDDHIVIEQFLTYMDYLTKLEYKSVKRKLYYGQFNPMFNFRH
jgi:hypothetical protein